MATAVQVVVPRYQLELSEVEATYLKGLVQNYLGDPDPEPLEDERIRAALFVALKTAGVQ